MKFLEQLLGKDRTFLERSLATTVEVGLRYFLFAGIAWNLA
jgi:hypothetical protein